MMQITFRLLLTGMTNICICTNSLDNNFLQILLLVFCFYFHIHHKSNDVISERFAKIKLTRHLMSSLFDRLIIQRIKIHFTVLNNLKKYNSIKTFVSRYHHIKSVSSVPIHRSLLREQMMLTAGRWVAGCASENNIWQVSTNHISQNSDKPWWLAALLSCTG